MSAKDFPMKNKEINDDNKYEGRVLETSDYIKRCVQKAGLSQRQEKRFRVANLQNKGILFEDDFMQIGIRTNMIYDYMSNKNHLNCTLFIENKKRIFAELSSFLNLISRP